MIYNLFFFVISESGKYVEPEVMRDVVACSPHLTVQFVNNILIVIYSAIFYMLLKLNRINWVL